jgi:antitoxin (DNA-binding transcriptional repressor) of toxin-antitoxin stability system
VRQASGGEGRAPGKACCSAVLAQVEAGEEVVITRRGAAIARSAPRVRKDDTHLIRTSEADDLINLAEFEDYIHEKSTRCHPLSEQT